MKKVLFAIPFLALFSCNTEIPRDQFIERLTSDCKTKHVDTFLGESATAEQKESFCDCYAETIAGEEGEAITMKTMIDKMKNAEAFASELETCKKDALADDKGEDVEEKQEPSEDKDVEKEAAH